MTEKRILSIGGDLEFATKNCSWDEETNVKDFDIVFLKLESFINADTPAYPLKRDVKTLLIETEGDVIAVLPDYEEGPEKPVRYSHELEWLPIEVSPTVESGESISAESVAPEWEWYFDENFHWDTLIAPEEPQTEAGERPAIGLDTAIKLGEKGLSQTSYTPKAKYRDDRIAVLRPLAKNSYSGNIAVELSFYKIQSDKAIGLIGEPAGPIGGSVFLIPLKPGLRFEDLAEQIIENNYRDVDLGKGTDEIPDWVDKYTLPREREILEQIKELRNQQEGMARFKELLYEN